MGPHNLSSAREKRTYRWIGSILPEGNLTTGERENLVYHLIGTDRAFGIYFPEFFLYEIPEHKITSFFKLFVASRAYLIAHDALKDGDRTSEIRNVLRESEQAFRRECVTCLKECIGNTEDVEKIMTRQDEISNEAYSHEFNQKVPSIDFACERVAYWYLVFEALDVLQVNTQKIKRLFDLSLFLLQLADDFSDIDEDYKKKNNCNLLGWNKGNLPTLPNEELERYALTAIWLTAKQILNEFGEDEPICKWAQEVINLLIIPDESKLFNFCNNTFIGDWPESYMPPHVNSKLGITPIPKIKLNSMNGVTLSAESINSFATNRSINKLKEVSSVQ